MKNKIFITGGICDIKMINDLNSTANYCIYEYMETKDFTPAPEAMLIVYELVLNLSYSATYDLLKTSLMTIISKIKTKHTEKKNKFSQLVVICNDDKSIIDLPFELTDLQKDKLVDAAIQKFLK